MRRLFVALFLVLVASPSWAATSFYSWVDTGVSGLLTSTDIQWAVCDSTHLAIIDRGTSTAAGGFRLVTWSGGSPSVSASQALPSPVTTTLGRALALGCDSTNLYIGWGGDNSTGWGGASASISTPNTYTLFKDALNGGSDKQSYVGAFEPVTPGNKDLVSGYTYNGGGSDDQIYSLSISTAGVLGNYAIYSTFANRWADQCTSIRVTTSFEWVACAGSSLISPLGWGGTHLTALFTPAGGTCTGPATSGGLIRPAFQDGTRGIALAYNGTNTFICGQNISGTKQMEQTISSVDVRPGVVFQGLDLIISTAGAVYASSGGTFVRASTYDISSTLLNGATVTGLVGVGSPSGTLNTGIDPDADGTADPMALLSDGRMLRLKLTSGSASVSRSSTGTGPFH